MIILDTFSLKRTTHNTTVNTHGEKLIDLCRSANLIACNGRFGMDEQLGKLSFCGHMGTSLDDYALVDREVIPLCANFEVKDFNIFSDLLFLLYIVMF